MGPWASRDARGCGKRGGGDNYAPATSRAGVQKVRGAEFAAIGDSRAVRRGSRPPDFEGLALHGNSAQARARFGDGSHVHLAGSRKTAVARSRPGAPATLEKHLDASATRARAHAPNEGAA